MKRLLTVVLVFVFASSLIFAQAPAPAASSKGTAGTWQQVPIPKLPAFKPQQPTRIQLSNGMVIFLQEDHELPLINGFARIRGGSRTEPADKVGMVSMYGQVWRTGGTKDLTGDQLDDFLEARAAKVETHGGLDSTTIGFNCLKPDFADVFKVFLDLLHNPAFREDKLKLTKGQMKSGISRRNDDSDSIGARESAFLAYGKDNPYARQPEYYTVDAVTTDDLAAYHKQYVHPNNLYLGISGDFDTRQMEATLRAAFESWEKGPAAEAPKLEPSPAKPGLYVVDKDDVNQSDITMVTTGIRRDNPDYFALQVLNELFGGGFASRLFSNLRTKRNLAYSVYGYVGAAYDHTGVTELSIGTKSATTAESIQGLWEEVDKLKSQPPTTEELNRAKESLLNSFVFHFDSPDKVLRERMNYDFYGYPADSLDRYRSAVEKVTLEDVARVATKYWHKDQFAVLVVGKMADVEKSLQAIGPLTKIDITIPEGKPGTAKSSDAKPAASTPEGKALAGKILQSLGGAEKVAGIKATRELLSAVQKSPQGDVPMELDVTTVYPDRLAMLISVQGNNVRQVFTPEAAFVEVQGQVQDLPASAKSEMLGQLHRDVFSVLRHMNDEGYTFATAGSEKVGGVNTTVLAVTAQGAPIRWYVDPSNGNILRIDDTGVSQAGPVQQSSFFSDFKTYEGVPIATKLLIKQNGEDFLSIELKDHHFNPQVDPKVFEKPAAK